MENYYFLALEGILEGWTPAQRTEGRNWNASVLNDKLLPAYVKDYPVDDGISTNGMDHYWYYPGAEYNVILASLTKEGYEYFSSLIAQFHNDGGAYQPAPASPPTNISNGGLGFFGATAVSTKKGTFD